MLPTITLEGRAVADPELRFTQSGSAVTSFRVACSESKKNDRGEWEDGDKLFVNVSIWKEAAEHVAEFVRKGEKVVVTGRLYQREYETRDGGKGQSLEVKFATVSKPIEAPRGERLPGSQGGSSTSATAPTTSSNDPWGAPAAAGEPPF